MNNRERVKAIMNYEKYDRMPIACFSYWKETLEKWVREGHLSESEIQGIKHGNEKDINIFKKLGFDLNWGATYGLNAGLFPLFEYKLIEELPDGLIKSLNTDGVVVLERKNNVSIPQEVEHLLKDRESWEELYLPKLQYSDERIDMTALKALQDDSKRDNPLGLYVGSLFGQIRNWLGIVGVSYLYADDEELYDEIINTVGDLTYKVTEKALKSGAKFDFIHYWEDICFKNGPLVIPSVFEDKVGPHYRKINDMVNSYGISIISLDCDGLIDSLLPTWLNNGVNTMFPIEVGTWNANIIPWREKYGRKLKGVGGMNKNIFALDYSAIDKEIERLKPQIELGGFIPCPDHLIPPDAIWENIQYYCDKMKKLF